MPRCLAQYATARIVRELAAPWEVETQPDPYGGIDVMLLPRAPERFSVFVISWCGAWTLGECRDERYRLRCARRRRAELLAELRRRLREEMAADAARAA